MVFFFHKHSRSYLKKKDFTKINFQLKNCLLQSKTLILNDKTICYHDLMPLYWIYFKWLCITVESLEFEVAQLWWYSWVEFTSTTKTNYKSFPTETENRHIHEITPPRISKTPIIHEN